MKVKNNNVRQSGHLGKVMCHVNYVTQRTMNLFPFEPETEMSVPKKVTRINKFWIYCTSVQPVVSYYKLIFKSKILQIIQNNKTETWGVESFAFFLGDITIFLVCCVLNSPWMQTQTQVQTQVGFCQHRHSLSWTCSVQLPPPRSRDWGRWNALRMKAFHWQWKAAGASDKTKHSYMTAHE